MIKNSQLQRLHIYPEYRAIFRSIYKTLEWYLKDHLKGMSISTKSNLTLKQIAHVLAWNCTYLAVSTFKDRDKRKGVIILAKKKASKKVKKVAYKKGKKK